MDTTRMTAKQAEKEIEARETERRKVMERVNAIAPGGEARAYHFPRGPEYRTVLDGEDPEAVVALDEEFRRLVARLEQLDHQLGALRTRHEEAELEETRARAPKEIQKLSKSVLKGGERVLELETEIRQARGTLKRDADALVEIRKVVGDGAPGMTPEALHQLWAAKWGTDDNGSVAWRGDNQGTVREKLLRDVYAYLELPDAEADALVEDWKRRVAGLDVAGYKVAGKRDEFVRKLQEKRVRAIAEGDFE